MHFYGASNVCLLALASSVAFTLNISSSLAVSHLTQIPPGLEQGFPGPQEVLPPELEPIPEPEPPEPLPPPEELIRPPELEPSFPQESFENPDLPSARLCINGFHVLGSTVFSSDHLDQAIRQALRESIGPPNEDLPDCLWQLTFPQLLITRSAVTDLYIQQGYVTSGAFIPADQRLQDGIVTLQVIEGRLTDIRVDGTQRLQSGYIASRLNAAAPTPLNINQLLEGLQLLRLDPLIETISAELQAGLEVGTSRLQVEVVEADSFSMQVGLDNNRSTSVGSLRRSLSLNQGNLTGLGDGLNVAYSNTEGSNEVNLSYAVPVSPHDSSLGFTARFAENRIVEGVFRPLGISAETNEYSLIFEHPLVQTPEQQFSLGLSLSRRFSQTRLGFAEIGPFPLSPGADNQGRTVVSALQFAQTWTQRQPNQVVALRSQFSLGLGGFLGGTVNADSNQPDGRFFAWQGQGQLVRRLGEDSLLLVQSNVQIAAEELLSSEQISLGGQSTVRGYRENTLLTDSGLLTSVEVRLPIMRVPDIEGVLQIAPFVDAGYGWNVGANSIDSPLLLGVGAGLLWQQPNLSARFDWGIPLTSAGENAIQGKRNWQENGLYFSINYAFF
ncbi:MAG: hemolysin activation/secretion protein [Leptolyngbya sp.]|nr:MAG: hemolysin activation/secretion protein [Leptolyngbya sp.]